MKIKLKSQLFKDCIGGIEVELDDEHQISMLKVADDINCPKINRKEERLYAIEDYTNLTSNPNVTMEKTRFFALKDGLAEEFLKIKAPIKEVVFSKSSIDFAKISDVDFKTLESLALCAVENPNGKRARFENAKSMYNLTKIQLLKDKSIDLDAFFSDLPNPEKVKQLDISEELPSASVMQRLTGLTTIEIANIQDSLKLRDFLSNIPLERIKELTISNSDLSKIDDEIFERLNSIKVLRLNSNKNVNYNQLISDLPNRDTLTYLHLSEENDKYEVDFKLLDKFNINFIWINGLKINFPELSKFLEKNQQLTGLRLNNFGPLDNLDFLDKISKNANVYLEDKDFDFGLVTADIIKEHPVFEFSDMSGQCISKCNDPDSPVNPVKVTISVDNLFKLENIIEDSSNIERMEIIVPKGSNGINQIKGFVMPYLSKFKDGIVITVEDFTTIFHEDLEKINGTGKVSAIKVLDEKLPTIESRFQYSPEDYKALHSKIEEITCGIPEDLDELKKFMIIYRRIGDLVKYDYGIIDDNKYTKYAKDNIDNSRNLVNGLMQGTCVCAGYADILYNCLREVGIDCRKIDGIGGGDYHEWNKVKINGKWYNTDLTWDSDAIKSGNANRMYYCLISDWIFKKTHKQTFGATDKCESYYSRREIKKAMKFAMKFDNIKRKEGVFSRISNAFKKNFGVQKTEAKALMEPKIIEPISKINKASIPSWELTENERKEVNSQIATLSNKDQIVEENTKSQEDNFQDRY